MKRIGVLLLALVLALLMTACSADPEKDAQKIVAEVGGTQVTKGEALEVYDFLHKQIVASASQYYQDVDPADRDLVSSAKTQTLKSITEKVALEKKLDEMGLALTEAELARLQESVDDIYAQEIANYMATYSVSEDEAQAAADRQGLTWQAIYYFAKNNMVEVKLRNATVTNISVTEDEVRAAYDALVEQDAAKYAEDPGQFSADVVDGTTVYAAPEGYRYVKNLVVGFPLELRTQIMGLDQEQYAAFNAQINRQIQLMTASGMSDEDQAQVEREIADYAAEYERLDAEITALVEQGRAEIQEQAEAVLALCQAEDADFDALMKEYNVDSGTTQSALVEKNGYPVSADSANYVTQFAEAAMALENIGDISGLVVSNYGYNILLYTGDVPVGAFPFEEVENEAAAAALRQAEDSAFAALKDQWLDEAKIKTYISRL